MLRSKSEAQYLWQLGETRDLNPRGGIFYLRYNLCDLSLVENGHKQRITSKLFHKPLLTLCNLPLKFKILWSHIYSKSIQSPNSLTTIQSIYFCFFMSKQTFNHIKWLPHYHCHSKTGLIFIFLLQENFVLSVISTKLTGKEILT